MANETADLVADRVIDRFDREVESGSELDLADVAVSLVMDLVVIVMTVLHTVSSVTLASTGLSWALNWILLMTFLARNQRGMMRRSSGGSTISLILGLPPVDQARMDVPATART